MIHKRLLAVKLIMEFDPAMARGELDQPPLPMSDDDVTNRRNVVPRSLVRG